ncbi:MAG: hypothetical protein K9M55_05885 [Candidatus Marinimicrobia bacterium]|nr:hypothetical protein [Candidatus Neomarinimicrobiota bacterium]MCF7922214.1 hypothetical protein [Candidatus Neomarinimicrobiota bacterium]
MKRSTAITILGIIMVLSNCATFKTDTEGSSGLQPEKTMGAEPVDVLFVSKHLVQTRGLDAVPKLQNRYRILDGYDDILLDATTEFSNLNRFAAFTEFASDMSDPERLALKDSLMANYELRIAMQFRNEKSFSKYFLGTIGSVLSLTLIPIPYTHEYYLDVEVFDDGGRLIKTYSRSAKTKKWIQAFLLPIYPFHTEIRKTEEIYVDFLHDVFREIDADQILRAGKIPDK